MTKRNDAGTGLTVQQPPETSQYLALSGDQDFREAMQANIAPGQTVGLGDLIRIKTPSGGGRTWQYVNSDGVEVEEKAITGIFVYWQDIGRLWGSLEPTKGERPVVTSYDGMAGVRTNEKLGSIDPDQLEAFRTGDRTYAWLEMCRDGSPFGWGTAPNGRGRLAKVTRVIGILQPGETWPVLISVGAGSFEVVKQFMSRLKLAHWRCVVSATLRREANKDGIEYSQIVLATVGTLSPEEGTVVKQLYTEPLLRMTPAIASATDGE